jgi:hypothetical protein
MPAIIVKHQQLLVGPPFNEKRDELADRTAIELTMATMNDGRDRSRRHCGKPLVQPLHDLPNHRSLRRIKHSGIVAMRRSKHQPLAPISG